MEVSALSGLEGRARQECSGRGGASRPSCGGPQGTGAGRVLCSTVTRSQLVAFILGAVSCFVLYCGAADPSQGPWEPGALRAALSLGGQATAGGALH